MLIRPNTPLQQPQFDGTNSKIPLNEPLDKRPNSISSTTLPAPSKTPQNRYEALFIKLFAKTTLQLILSFSAIFLSIVTFRDLLGLRINVSKFAFWFQFLLNLSLFVALIFAKMKCISNIKTSPLSNPFEYYFNQDQMILLGVWTASAFNFGSWYFRQYAPKIYKLFNHIKGKSSPSLRQQYFLIWATLLCQGITFWISSNMSKKSFTKNNGNLSNFLKSQMDVKFLSNLLNKSALIFYSLVSIHFLVSWFAFPIFGFLISGLIEINSPIRHSWRSIFNFGIIFHLFTFSIISNLIYSLIDLLIEFYLLNQTFKTSAILSQESAKLLAIGICKTKQSFIHLQALQEFNEITNDSNPRGQLERFKIYSSIEDEGSLSGEILNWFTDDLLKDVRERSEISIQELNLVHSALTNENNNNSSSVAYTGPTIGFVESILKKIFTSESSSSTVPTSAKVDSDSVVSNLPEVFARRGPVLKVAPAEKEITILPFIFQIGQLRKKYSLGNRLISYWIASSKIFPVANSNLLQISIKSIESFICKSFDEDETGQVQLNLPKVFETTIETVKLLENLAEIVVIESEIVSKAEKEIDLIVTLLKEMLKNISVTFKETLDDVRISLKCREYIKSL